MFQKIKTMFTKRKEPTVKEKFLRSACAMQCVSDALMEPPEMAWTLEKNILLLYFFEEFDNAIIVKECINRIFLSNHTKEAVRRQKNRLKNIDIDAEMNNIFI